MKLINNIFKLIIFWLLFPSFIFLILGNLYSLNRIKTIKNDAIRPQNKYSLSYKGLAKFKKNINSREKIYFGDICGIAGYEMKDDRCPFSDGIRYFNFKTDNFGFKTLQNFEDSTHIIVGDSFLAGLGGNQMQDQFGYQLSNKTNFSFYEAGHPGDPRNYIERIDYFASLKKFEKRFIVMLFEGNDLVTTEQAISNNYVEQEENKINNFVTKMPLYKLLKHYFFGRGFVGEKIRKIKSKRFELHTIEGLKKAFLKEYIDKSNKDMTLKKNDFDDILSRKNLICSIIYIPTASSVYLTNKTTEERHPSLSNLFKEFRENDIEVIDFTEIFKNYSKTNQGNLLYWKDDTHWNKKGIEIAVDNFITSSKCIN